MEDQTGCPLDLHNEPLDHKQQILHISYKTALPNRTPPGYKYPSSGESFLSFLEKRRDATKLEETSLQILKKLSVVVLTIGLTLSVQAAEAPSDRWGPSYQNSVNSSYWWGYQVFWRITRHHHNNNCGHIVRPVAPTRTSVSQAGPSVSQVPELDAAGAGLSLALLGLFIGVMRERRKIQR